MLFIADFDATEIAAFPSHAEAACDIHFEWEHPARGWERYLALSTEYSGFVYDDRVLPPHDQTLVSSTYRPRWCASEIIVWPTLISFVDAYQVQWRIVDGEGAVLTTFVGPYAEDAGPLAAALGEQAAYRRGRRDPACVAAPGRECWTALELWMYLEEWQDAHCAP